jgi:hypothetical protein
MEDAGSGTLPIGAPADPCDREVVDEVRRSEGLRLVAMYGHGEARGGGQQRMEVARRRASPVSDCAAAWRCRGAGAGEMNERGGGFKGRASSEGEVGEVGRRETWARGACEERGREVGGGLMGGAAVRGEKGER